MAIEFRCDNCAKLLQVADQQAHSRARCPACGQISQVPAAAPQPIPDSDNPYRAPLAIEPWDRRDVFPPDYRTHALAGRWMRLGGAILDGIIYLGAVIPGFLLLVAAAPGDPRAEDFGVVVALAGMAVVAIINWAMVTRNGQSIAKRLLGMRIVRIENDALPGFVHGALIVTLRNASSGIAEGKPGVTGGGQDG